MRDFKQRSDMLFLTLEHEIWLCFSPSSAFKCVLPDLSSLTFEDVSRRSCGASLMAQTVEESACNAGDPDSIPGLGRSPGEGNGNPLHGVLAWRIPWTEEPDGLQSMGFQRVRHD